MLVRRAIYWKELGVTCVVMMSKCVSAPRGKIMGSVQRKMSWLW